MSLRVVRCVSDLLSKQLQNCRVNFRWTPHPVIDI